MHKFLVGIGKFEWLDKFESRLLNRVHFPEDNAVGSIQPNVRRIRIYSIVVGEAGAKEFIKDLSPFNHGSGRFKDSAKMIGDLIRRSFGLKKSEESWGKRQLIRPEWRDWVSIFMIGFKDVGDGLRKYYIVAECQRKYSDIFFHWLHNRLYKTGLPNRPGAMIQPAVNELRFFDVSTFESCDGQMRHDLAPYTSIDDDKPAWLVWGFKLARKEVGLKNPPKSTGIPSDPVAFPFPRDKMNLYMLAEKPDVKMEDPDSKYYGGPSKGEMV